MDKVSPDKVAETIGRHMLVDGLPIVVDLEKSRGNRLVDRRDGRSYLDCHSYIASNALGHNHPKLHDADFEKKLLTVARTKPSNPDFYTEELATFVDTFSRVAMPDEFAYLFFVEGGSVAVENALKAAFDWKVRKNFAKGIAEERGHKVIHFLQAFHGRGGYTLSLTNTADLRKTKYFARFDWPRVLNPKVAFPLEGENLKAVIEAEAESVRQIEEAFRANPDDIAAIIIEPIQGEGGDNHFRPEFHQTLRRLADDHEALLIYDEVQTGLGLTGRMWAYQHYGMVPDIVAFGKKTQVCGIMAGRRLDEVENHVFKESSRINSTFGGNLVDMVRCQRYLEVIEEERLLENAARVGAVFQERLRALADAQPNVFSNARGKGLLCAVDAASPELRDRLLRDCAEAGLLLLKCGPRSLRVRPSLIFSEAEVDEAIQIITTAVSKL